MRTKPATPRKPDIPPIETNTIPHGAWRQWLIVSLCVFAISLAALWWNAAPSISFHDSGEFAMAAASGGIPHPPGAPTWTILATIFVKLGRFHDPARGTNLFSGLWGAITLALLCWLMQLWIFKIFPSIPRWVHSAAGISAALVVLHSSGFLEQSFIAEQYTQMVALMMGVVIAATLLVLRSEASQPVTKTCALMGLLWGLAIGNHLSQLALGLLAVWAIWAASKRENRLRDMMRLGGICALGLMAGLLVFLWLPIRSHANPIMDWGNAKSLDRFIWAITRQQWQTRLISEAPRNLLPEWIASYDPLGQIGVLGLLLSVVGILALVRKQRMWLGWMATISIPYGAGMIYAHLHQKSILADYICTYGVTDWHLPIYLALAMGAAVGLSALVSWTQHRRSPAVSSLVVVAVLCCLLITAGRSVRTTSLRHYTAPDKFVQDLLAPLPPDAVVLAAQDNIGFMLGYHRYISNLERKMWVLLRYERIDRFMTDESRLGVDSEIAKRTFVERAFTDRNNQPFRVSIPESRMKQPMHVYCDFLTEFREESAYLLPAGYMFEFMGRKTSNVEVLQAERQWRKRCPDLFRQPAPNTYRLERDAYSRLHMSRGVFFASRKMWNEAVESYKLSLDWIGNSGATWFYLADALDKAGKVPEAVEDYKRAIAYIPTYGAPRYNLAACLRIPRYVGEFPNCGVALAAFRECLSPDFRRGSVKTPCTLIISLIQLISTSRRSIPGRRIGITSTCCAQDTQASTQTSLS